MPEPEPTRRLHAVDIKTGHGVVAAKIIGPAVEANRAAIIQELVGEAMDECADDLHFVVFDLADVDFLNSSAVAAFLTLSFRSSCRLYRYLNSSFSVRRVWTIAWSYSNISTPIH